MVLRKDCSVDMIQVSCKIDGLGYMNVYVIKIWNRFEIFCCILNVVVPPFFKMDLHYLLGTILYWAWWEPLFHLLGTKVFGKSQRSVKNWFSSFTCTIPLMTCVYKTSKKTLHHLQSNAVTLMSEWFIKPLKKGIFFNEKLTLPFTFSRWGWLKIEQNQ